MPGVVVIGCGFAGFSAARRLARSAHSFEVTVIDKRTTFDFLPLLPDIVGRPLSPALVSCPIEPLSLQYGFNYIHDAVTVLDLQNKRVQTNSTSLSYDYLIVASGSQTNFYGNDALKEYAYTLDNVADAQSIRRALDTEAFDTCLVAGGGYTGIEIATHIRRYCSARGNKMKLLIVEQAPSLLGPLPEWMKQYVSDNIESMGIGVRTNTVVQRVDAAAFSLSDGTVFENALLGPGKWSIMRSL